MGYGRRALRYLATSLLLGALATVAASPAGAQEGAAREAPAEWEEDPVTWEPIRLGWESREALIEVTVERWGEAGKAQRFRLQLEKRPGFVRESVWLPGDTILFEPNEAEKVVTLRLLLAEGGGPEGEIVISVRPEDESLSPRERRFVLPCSFGAGTGGGNGFLLRAAAPEEIPAGEIPKRVDRAARPLYASDRIAVFFTPPADPKAGKPVFWWQILGPEGKDRQGGLWNPGDWYTGDPLEAFAEKGAPAPFGTELRAGGRDRLGCLKAGRYIVRCAPHVVTDLSLLGQKGGKAGEFKDVGAFDVLPLPDLVFEQFIVEPASQHALARHESVDGGTVEIGGVSVEGRRARFSGRAAWRPRERGWREGEWIPSKEERRLEAWLQVTFPETLRMSQDILGEADCEFQPNVARNAEAVASMQFVGALCGLVPIGDRGPDRSLVLEKEVPRCWAGVQRGKEQGSWFLRAYAFGASGADYHIVAPAMKSRPVIYPAIERLSGRPEREIGDHLRDPRTRFILPVRFSFLTNDDRTFDQLGYAVYRPAGGRGP